MADDMDDSVFIEDIDMLEATSSLQNLLESSTLCISLMSDFTNPATRLELFLEIDNETYIATLTSGDGTCALRSLCGMPTSESSALRAPDIRAFMFQLLSQVFELLFQGKNKNLRRVIASLVDPI